MLGRPTLLLILGATLAGCAQSESSAPTPTAPAAAAPPTPSPEAAPATPAPLPAPLVVPEEEAPPAVPEPPRPTSGQIETGMREGAYRHARLGAGPQTTVRWLNEDAVFHTVLSPDGRFAGSGPIPPGSEFVFTFQTPGEYAFYCRIHAGMSGTLAVR